jgi:hypothetical protein
MSEAERAQAAEAVAKTREQLDSLAVAWPSVVPPEHVDTDASLLYGAAARIEIASLSVQ